MTNFTIAQWPDGATHTFTYTLTFRAPGDADASGSIDHLDFVALEGCVGGPENGPVTADCQTFDFTCDDDVDLSDAAAFQVLFSSP